MRVTRFLFALLLVVGGLVMTSSMARAEAPTITSITTINDDRVYDVGNVIPIRLDFSESIYTDGDVTITVNASVSAGCVFNIASSTPVSNVSCNYTIAIDDDANPLNVATTTGDIFNTTDELMVSFSPVSNLADAHSIIVNTTAPRIASITSDTPDDNYMIGDSIVIDVNFSEYVYTDGDITLGLNSGADCEFRVASSSPVLTASCTYVIAEGESTPDLNVSSIIGNMYSSTTTEQMVNFKIRGKKLASDSNIVVDGIVPTITSVSTIMPDGYYKADDTIVLDVIFSSLVTTLSTSTISLDPNASSTCAFATISSATTTISCIYTVASGDNSADLSISDIVATFYDVAGNQNTSTSTGNIFSSDHAIIVDTNAPTATLFGTPDDSTTSTAVNITVGGTEVNTYRYMIDGSSWNPETSTTTTISITLTVGSHTIEVRGSDLAGNWQVDPTTYSWTISSSGGGGGGGGGYTPPEEPQVLGVKIYSFSSGRMIKVNGGSAVYHITDDGLRHLYVNEVTYWTWHTGSWTDQGVETVTQEEFDGIEEGSHVTVKPDTKLIKFENSERIYLVAETAIINQASEEVRLDYYGENWKDELIIIQNGFETDYMRGLPIVL